MNYGCGEGKGEMDWQHFSGECVHFCVKSKY